MPTEPRQPNWFLHDGQSEIGPIGEVELRTRLAKVSKNELANQRVRQGSSQWHPAAHVLARFKALAQNGVYVRLDHETQGPFTPERAAEMLKTSQTYAGVLDQVQVKVGRQEPWQPATQFLASLERLLRSKSESKTSPVDPKTRPAMAILIDDADDDEPLLFEATLVTEPARTVSFNRPTAVDGPSTKPRPVQATPVQAIPVQQDPLQVDPFQTVGFAPPPAPPAAPRYLSGPPKLPERPTFQSPISRQSDGGTSNAVKGAMGVAMSVILAIGFVSLKAYNRYQRRVANEPPAMTSPSERMGNRTGFAERPPSSPMNSNSQMGPGSPPIDPMNSRPPMNSGGPMFSGPGASRGQRAPIVRPGMLFRPTFETNEGPVSAGTAFAARLSGSRQTIILSALHLFGPAGGMSRDVPPSQLPTVWRSLQLSDCVTRQELGSTPGNALVLPQTKPMPAVSEMGDVVAYMPAPGNQVFSNLELTAAQPAVGDRVWLVSAVVSGGGLTHAATVEGYEDGWLVYRFDDPTIEIMATSGAPVVNGQQQVVAINAGGGASGGRVMGVGTPTSKFLEPLARAAGLR